MPSCYQEVFFQAAISSDCLAARCIRLDMLRIADHKTGRGHVPLRDSSGKNFLQPIISKNTCTADERKQKFC